MAFFVNNSLAQKIKILFELILEKLNIQILLVF